MAVVFGGIDVEVVWLGRGPVDEAGLRFASGGAGEDVGRVGVGAGLEGSVSGE